MDLGEGGISNGPGLWLRERALQTGWPAAAALLAAALLVAPLWLVALPAMPDLPAHIASFFLLSGGVHDPLLAHFYRIEWRFVPNLASELSVPFLARAMGLVAATKLFLSAAVVFWVGGVAWIQRALFGRVQLTALLAAFFAYNVNFFWGFMNYDFAAGLALMGFAAWIASAGWPRAARLPAFALFVFIIYFCHVFAAAVLLLLIGCFELSGLIRARALFSRQTIVRGLELAVLTLPAALAFVFLKPPGADNSHLEFNYLATWDDRIGAAYQYRFDEPGYVLLGILALFWVVGLWRGWIRLHPSLYIALVALLICVVFLPEWALGGWGVDLRVPPVLGAMAFAAAELRLAPRWRAVLSVVVLAGLGFAAATAGGNWCYYDRQYAEFRGALAHSPRGTRIMIALDGDAMGLASDQPYWHMAEFAITDRGGFSPLLFTTAGQHVVRLQPAFQGLAAATAQQGSPPDIGELSDLAAGQVNGDTDIRDVFPYLKLFQCHYNEVVVIRSGGKASPAPAILHRRYRGSFFDLYDVRRDGACNRS